MDNARKIKVMVVDDNPEFVGAAVKFLSGLNSVEAVFRATSGVEALEVISFRTPDLVLVDLVMPMLTGLDVARLAMSLPAPPTVVMVSLYGAAEYRAMAKAAGVDIFIEKDEFADRVPKIVEEMLGAR